ncbi:MAG: septum formation initiator family protein [Verrucomicrobiae bacterium]|nr:septum formation initiator family protein [Verrucomicrobiae bacterium]
MNRRRHHSPALDAKDLETETVWQTLSRITVTFIVLAALGVAFTFFIPELDHQRALDRDIARLEAERDIAQEKRDDLRQELRWLNDDRDYLELKAREILGMYKPKEGEEILQIEGNEPNKVGNTFTTGATSSDLPPTG